MNYLAHLVLAPQTPQGLVGSIAPDMIRGPLPNDLHPEAARAAAEHQRIDRFTDTHRAFQQTRQRLGGLTDRRLTGILADVLYDHVLARDWSRWRSDPLDQYLADTEQRLLSQAELIPTDMQWKIKLMAREQWLASYATADGIRARLTQMSKRISGRLNRPMNLTPTAEQLEAVYPDLADDFAVFWPELCRFVTDRRREDETARLAS